ncbi:MAG: endolytic transglycosylase MltG [Halioglobus sp.]|nr:endolytic transglycosylase MltG [Halioglobus sp.]
MIRGLLLASLIAVALGTLAGMELLRRWEAPLQIPPGGYRFTVAAGDSLSSVARRLHAEGVLPHPRLLTLYGRMTGQDQQIKRGEYLLPEYATALQVLQLLHRGRVVEYQVTLPEGITLARALRILSRHEALHAVLSGPGDPRLLELARPHATAEGLFFPDSYRFTRGATDFEILRRAHRAMNEILAAEWRGRASELPYASPYEALIMASIIERETGLPAERRRIAGVFVRRLQRGMRLQTDPTVIYGLGETFDGNLRRSHLADAGNRYNSYRHHGLPPSPIALPGRAAVHAALHPEPGDALYFVARGNGGHVFSATLAEHRKAVRKYQLDRRENYRSAPPVSR